MLLRFGSSEIAVDPNTPFDHVKAAAGRLVEMECPEAEVVGLATPAVRCTPSGLQPLVATTAATYNALCRCVGSPAALNEAVLEVVLLQAAGGIIHLFTHDEVLTTSLRFLRCIDDGNATRAPSVVRVNLDSPPTVHSLRGDVAQSLGLSAAAFAEQFDVVFQVLENGSDIEHRGRSASSMGAILIDDEDDIDALMNDLEEEGARNVVFRVVPRFNNRRAPASSVAAAAQSFVPPADQSVDVEPAVAAPQLAPSPQQPDRRQAVAIVNDDYRTPSRIRQDPSDLRFVSVRCSFNPPDICIVGELSDHSRNDLEQAILQHCIGEARLKAFEGRRHRPAFEQCGTAMGYGIYRMTLKTLYFDDLQQTSFLLCVLDTMEQLREWRMVPCDGEVALDQDILAQEAKARAVAAQGPGLKKPQDPTSEFTQAFELLFLEKKRKPSGDDQAGSP